jgi:RimJ/RimL family protein N-acetyltransferase
MSLAEEPSYRDHGSPAWCEPRSVQRLSQSQWWLRRYGYLRAQRLEMDRQGSSVSANTGLVRCYADLIVKYWEHLHVAGALDRSPSLSVLQWGAGTGRFAYRLLCELRERLTTSAVSTKRLRYAACDEDTGAIESMRRHPYLQAELAAGRLVVRHIAGNEPQAWDEVVREYLLCPTAPLVVIANDVLGEAEQELVGFLAGKVFDATLECTAEEPSETAPLAWDERKPIAQLPVPWQSLLQIYATRLDNVPVLLPTGALNFIDTCAQLSGDQYLLLAADFGVHGERQLREGVYADITGRLPVNFDALARHQRGNGALTWNSAVSPQGGVVHLALNSPQWHVNEGLFGALVQTLRRYVPGDVEALLFVVRSAQEEVTCEQLLTAVRIADEDPRILAAIVEPLLAKLDSMTLECCLHWRDSLERVWNNYFPLPGEETFCFGIGTLAMHVGHWGVAKCAFAMALAIHGRDPELLHRLSYCEASTGGSPKALSLIQEARATDPETAVYREFESVLRARMGSWISQAWYRCDGFSDGELTLEPLGPQHAESLLFQYRDPQIGVMTRLPELTTKADVLAWLDEQSREAGRVLCAVMHACWGFVGVVSLRYDADSAYFYFWMGADYQGAGFGHRAAQILLVRAVDFAVRHVFTSAYTSNQRSRDALGRLGFVQMSMTATSPDEELRFFHWRSEKSAGTEVDPGMKLRALLQIIDSPITLAAERGNEHGLIQ